MTDTPERLWIADEEATQLSDQMDPEFDLVEGFTRYIRQDIADAAVLAERERVLGAVCSLPMKTEEDGYGKSHSPRGWANGYNRALSDVRTIRARTDPAQEGK